MHRNRFNFTRSRRADVHRCRAARPRRVPGRLPRPEPRGLHPRPAPVHRLVPRPVPAAILGPPHRHRDVRPRTGGTRPGTRHGHPAAVHHRRVHKYAVEEELLEHSPAAHVRRPRLDYESHATALDRNELGARLVAAGLGPPGEHALISLLALNGLRVSEATGADIEHLGLERGHRTLVITRKGGKVVTIPLAPRTARAIDLAIGERAEGPLFVTVEGQRLDRHGAARIVRRATRRAGITKHVSPHTLRHAFITAAALDAGVPLRDVQEAASHADPRTTMRYDRARTSLDRHATYIVAAFIAGAAVGGDREPPICMFLRQAAVRPQRAGTGVLRVELTRPGAGASRTGCPGRRYTWKSGRSRAHRGTGPPRGRRVRAPG